MEALIIIGVCAVGLIIGVCFIVAYCAYFDGVFDMDLSKPHDEYD